MKIELDMDTEDVERIVRQELTEAIECLKEDLRNPFTHKRDKKMLKALELVRKYYTP